MKSYSNNRPQGRGGSSQGSMRGKSISTRLSAPAPVNLPSRRQELAGNEAHGSQSSSWGSPSVATAALGASSANSTPGDSPIVPTTGTMTTTQTGTTSMNGVAGGDSPHLDTSPIGSPFHKPIARAWGAVTQPSDQRTEEYPTAAEAAKKIHHDHHESPLTNGGHNTTNGKKANVDDEGVDFLNAGEIQFADGSVVVTSTVASSETQGPGKDTKEAPERREERVVDRGDVDFNRGPSRSSNSGPSSSLYPHQPAEQPRYPPHDKAHPQLWQGGPPGSHREIDRRPSADRGHMPSQRRDSAGHGPNRRDSHGSKDPFSGPRRDSAQHHNYYERRDSFEHQHRPRDRDRDRNFPKENYRDRDNRDGDFNPDRRPSYDRPHERPHERPQDRPQDRFLERRDFQVLSRPRDHLDRHGPHDPSGHPSGHPFAHPTHSGPPPTNTHDTLQRDTEHVPGQSNPTLDDHTGDQKEAMRHAAEEARKRRENEEREFQESQARARAKADALAKQAEEIKAKAKEKEEEAAKAKAKEKEDRLHLKTSLSKSEVNAAMASWQALPEKLVKESEEREARSREEWRRKEEESKKAALSTNLTSTPPATVGAWKRSGISVTGKGTNEKNSVAKEEKSPLTGTSNGTSSGVHEVRVDQVDMIMHRIEDSLQARGTSVQEVGASMKRPSETHPIANGTFPDTSNSDTTKHQESEEKTSKDRVRNAKAARGKASVDSPASASSWRKEEPKTLYTSASTQEEEDLKVPEEVVTSTNPNPTEEQPNKATEKDHTTPRDAPIVNGIHTKAPVPATKIKKEASKPMAAPILSPDSYPAKMASHNDVIPKISDIARIHARLAHQAAGDVHANQEIGEMGHRARPVSKHPTKRNSLSNSTASTIFPSNVEQAALKRGSMSFMVESEIDIPLKGDKPTEPVLPMQTQWGDRTTLPLAPSLSKTEPPTNDSAKKAWDSTLVEADIATIFTPGAQNVNFRGVAGFPQGSAPQVPMGIAPNMYLLNAQVPGMVNPMAQPIWAPSVESSQGLIASGVVVPGGAPFPMAMPYFRGFPNGVPPPGYMLMVPQGMHPPMAQYVPSRLSVDGSVSPAQLRSLTGSPDVPDSMNDSYENGLTPQAGDESGVVEPMPMPWLPRFSVAGDAPQPQAPFILPQPQASIMAAANINRIPQSRPYGAHLQPQQMSRNHGSPEGSVPSPNGQVHGCQEDERTDPLVTKARHSINLTTQATMEAIEAEAVSTPTIITTATSDPMDEEVLAITNPTTMAAHNTIQMDLPPRPALVRMAQSGMDGHQARILASTVSRACHTPPTQE
ncbi:hypothetical protein BGZ74_001731 [Mortierella antarctica]|nr:hypothetical protein BGZ74_001731 [Mortierella antarctica]